MKAGRTLADLATEIMRQQESKRDFVAATGSIEMTVPESAERTPRLVLHGKDGVQAFGINDTAHDQIANFTDIPRKYYDRMRQEAPELLARNVNRWLHAAGERRMIRTLDGNVRGLLSDRFRPLDNFGLAEAIFPVLKERKLDILSAEITERRLYIKAVDPQLQRDVPKGSMMGTGHTIFDTCAAAVTIGNSEIGFGALFVESGVYTRQCTNMATFKQHSQRRYHVGKKLSAADAAMEFIASQTTQRLEDAALWSRLADTVRGAFDQAQFDSRIKLLTNASEQKIEANPEKVVEVVAERFGFNETERGSVLRHLIDGGDLSRYGMFNAITRMAEDVDSYDRATEVEGIGGDVVMLPQSDWKRLAAAVSSN